MNFYIQKETEEIDIDLRILIDELKKQKFMHTYALITKEYANEYIDKIINGINEKEISNLKESIPVGNIDFVQLFLSKIHNIDNMNPIEVPNILRTDEFLKRKYSIVDKNELPKNGYYFTKYVSKLKEFSHIGMIETLQYTDNNREEFLKDGLYQNSEVVNFDSEFRCFIHNDKIVAINNYDGDCTKYPNIDTLNKMVNKYMLDEDRPRSYTMDVGVIYGKGTALIEIHPWVSIGLYGYMFGTYLPYAYRDGFLYYINCNKRIEKFTNS